MGLARDRRKEKWIKEGKRASGVAPAEIRRQLEMPVMKGAAMRRALLAPLMVAALACTQDSGGGATNPLGPNRGGEPSDSDWLALVGELAAIGADGIQAAYVSSGVLQLAAPLALTASTNGLTAPSSSISGSTTYFCCGGSLARDLTVASTLTAASGGSAALVQAFADTNVEWKLATNGTPTSIELSLSGVTLTGNLTMTDTVLNGVQQLRLSGTVTYTVSGGEVKTSYFEVYYGYQNYPSGIPTATGQAGPARANGPLPTPLASRCTKVPREGCGPCRAAPCGDAPCGKWPACPK